MGKRKKGPRFLLKRTHVSAQHTDKRKAAPRAESALNEKHTRIGGWVKGKIVGDSVPIDQPD